MNFKKKTAQSINLIKSFDASNFDEIIKNFTIYMNIYKTLDILFSNQILKQ